MKLWKLSGVNKFAPKRDEIPDEIWLENSSSVAGSGKSSAGQLNSKDDIRNCLD